MQRFREGYSALPPLEPFAALHASDRAAALELAEQHAWLMASEIVATGVDLSFAPVVDLGRGNRAIICCVDTTQLDAAFCGRDYDARLLRDLPASCDPCGENGEFHTCVLAGPWAEPLALVRGGPTCPEGRFAYVDLVEPAERT